MLDELESGFFVDAEFRPRKLRIERRRDDQHDEGHDQRRPADGVGLIRRQQADQRRSHDGQEGDES